MRDIQTQEDLYQILASFYQMVLDDTRIRYIFTDVVPIHLDLEEHLRMQVLFWSQALLGTGGYTNHLTQIHVNVHSKSPLTPELFEVWLLHFNTAIDQHFSGEKATAMKTQAKNLAVVMQLKIQ